MWLSNSSIGRKFIMALTGACLVLFVTFHCLMNAVCIAYPTAYNAICEFLGANWYALIASLGLAVLFILHIIYACWLTMMNRQARGNVRYAISKTPAGVEWSSKNMLVLGIVILAFLVVHLIQFWAKMQLVEIRGVEETIPAVAGTLFIQEAFQHWYTPVIYIIGFIALWFHMNHGMWSMFQSVGWTNNLWIPRLKKIACWWTSIVVLCFIAQAVVFTAKSSQGYYKTNEALRAQYMDMAIPALEAALGDGVGTQIKGMDSEQLNTVCLNILSETAATEELAAKYPEFQEQVNEQKKDPNYFKTKEALEHFANFMLYLSNQPKSEIQAQIEAQKAATIMQMESMLQMQRQMQQPQVQQAPQNEDMGEMFEEEVEGVVVDNNNGN